MRKATGKAVICEEEEEDDRCDAAAPHEDAKDRKKAASASGASKKKSNPGVVPGIKNGGPITLAKKVCATLHHDILSLKEDAANGMLPAHTIFAVSEESSMSHIVQMIRKECPNMCKDRRELVFQILSKIPPQGDTPAED